MNTKYKTLISVFILILLIACQKDMFLTNLSDKKVNDLTIEEAKSYYNKELKSTKIQKLASTNGHSHDENCNHNDTEQLMWDKSIYRQLIGGHQAVLTPLHRKGVYIKVGENKVLSYGLLNYTMMYKDSLNNIITERVLLKPSMNWFDGDRNKYDGSIIVYNWDGKVKKIFHFKDGSPINSIKKINKLASISNDEASSNNEDPPCLVTTTYRLTGGRSCPCAGHTASQYSECTCEIKPTQATLEVEVSIDCPPIDPEDPPIPPTGGGNGGESPQPGNGGGGSSSGGNYTPRDCVPRDQIDYTVPLGPNEEYAIACEDMPYPIEPPEIPIPTTSSNRLMLLFPDLTNEEKAYLISHELVADQIIATIIEGDESSFDLANWGITELSKGNITWSEFEELYITGTVSDFYSENTLETNITTKPINYSSAGVTSTFSEQEFNALLSNLENNINGDPIEFYLIASYKNSKILNSSTYSVSANSLQIGEFILTPHYDSNNLLKFYTASRNINIGIEYIVRGDALNMFKENYSLYKSAANAFYINGIPSSSQIQIAAGDFFDGLTNSWIDALRNPSYYMYLTHVLYGIGVNTAGISFKSTTIRNTNKISIKVTNYSSSQFKNLIRQKKGGNWIDIGSNRQRLDVGTESYISYPSSSSGGSIIEIHYFRNGKSIGVFRFNSN